MTVAFLFVSIVVGVTSAAIGLTFHDFSVFSGILVYVASSTMTFLGLALLSFLSPQSAEKSIGNRTELEHAQRQTRLHEVA